mmetsp:Transcript_14856/g.26287  ORF Transcript_14856/g.26287 Transcript_14856/m.26287 type:complete len:772 (-) Transcript_14856:118-2433(-)
MGADDDLYGGYEQETMGGYEKMGPPATAQALPPGSSRPPGSAFRAPAPLGTALGTGMRMGTGQLGVNEDGRPMTSNQGAGYSSAKPRGRFDPLQGGVQSSVAALQKKADSSPEEHCKDMERKVHILLEESAIAAAGGDAGAALERAKEAGRKERALCKQREQAGLADQISIDLTYAVCFNLAQMYHLNKHYTEALNTYGQVVKNKTFPSSGRLRVNMGNIYFEQGKYPNAIKMYRMALDQVSNTNKDMRFKIMKNIGTAFVKMGQYQDAMQSFDTVMENMPDHATGFNLVVCFYALGDKEKMKKSFQRLLAVPPFEQQDDEEEEDEEGDMNVDFIDDALKQFLRARQAKVRRQTMMAARLIAPVIDKTGSGAGFDWVADQLLKVELIKEANEVELAKANYFLTQKQFGAAVEVLKEFEKKEKSVKARAATNLSFLHFLEGDLENAEKYAELAVATDRYNARGLVNRGNVMMQREEYEQALTIYLEAVSVEADCTEAMFNLGLVNKRLGRLEDALAAFKKLNTILPHNIEVIYQVGSVHDLMGNYRQAIKWLEFLNTLVPNDPGVLARLGAIHAKYDDEAKALHFYQESHRVYPVNMDVISWLGAFHVKNEVYEKAMPYFDLASKIQPQEVKWQLMVASCYRRVGAFPQALAKYKEIHTAHPDNIECLRYLVHICTDLGRKDEVHDFVVKLRKAERMAAAETEARATAAAEAPVAAPQRPAEADSMTTHQRAHVPDEPAYRAPASNAKKANVGEKADDDWGNEELGDDLLPM